MFTPRRFAQALLLGAVGLASAADQGAKYPGPAPLAEYLATSAADEVVAARSAAPPSISANAAIMTLGNHGYETSVKGENGFVCMVWRSWSADLGDAEFWNPKIRAPICLNPASVRTVLPTYLERTLWVESGIPVAEMLNRTKAALLAKTFVLPEPGAMAYMLSKRSYLSDAGGHWHPHLMFFLAGTDGAAWGANLKDSPIVAAQSAPEPITTFFIPMGEWSDGTPDDMAKH
jgi:hypothetical protein